MLAQEDVFRVDVRLVRLLVTVKDQNGQRVGSLERPRCRDPAESAADDHDFGRRLCHQPRTIVKESANLIRQASHAHESGEGRIRWSLDSRASQMLVLQL